MEDNQCMKAIFCHASVFYLTCSLPHVLKGKARQAWEAIAGPLKSALNRLDADCQVSSVMDNGEPHAAPNVLLACCTELRQRP